MYFGSGSGRVEACDWRQYIQVDDGILNFSRIDIKPLNCYKNTNIVWTFDIFLNYCFCFCLFFVIALTCRLFFGVNSEKWSLTLLMSLISVASKRKNYPFFIV